MEHVNITVIIIANIIELNTASPLPPLHRLPPSFASNQSFAIRIDT